MEEITFSAIKKSERSASLVQMAPRRKTKTRYRNHLWVTNRPLLQLLNVHMFSNRLQGHTC